jgi:predicted nucleic acid-binding protein
VAVGAVITTRLVLAELGAALARSSLRHLFLAIVDQVEADPAIRVVAVDDGLFREGVEFFRQRPDKNWSLTDCVSFVVMQHEGISEALTADHHFEQAGFVALLK